MTGFKRWSVLALALMVLAAGCSRTDHTTDEPQVGTGPELEPASAAPETAGRDLLAEMEALYAQLDNAELPRQTNYWQELTAEALPPQLVLDQPLAYELALHIRKGYLHHLGNLLEPFEDVAVASLRPILRTALYNTAPIDLGSWGYTGGAGDICDFRSDTYPNHVLSLLVKTELEQNRPPSELFYAADVEETVATYYGVLEFDHVSPADDHLYHAREAVYTRIGDHGGPMWRYPQITSIEETADGLVCEAVLVMALNPDFPMNPEWNAELELTPENILRETAASPLYRYTFRREEDGRLVLRAFAILR